MSVADLTILNEVSDLIDQFNEYNDIFELSFLQYNGKTEVVTLHYRLRTFKSFMDGKEYLKEFLKQYFKNPIQIPSRLYSVQINHQTSTVNLARNQKYFIKVDDNFIFHISNLLDLDSEYVYILIDTKFKLNLNYLISSHISRQPKIIGKNLIQYELMSLLKTNIFPEKFQCLNIPIKYELILNNFIEHFIPKRFLTVSDKWYKMATYERGNFRKKKQYYNMIKQRFGIAPLEFNRRIQIVLDELLNHIRMQFDEVVKIKVLKGKLIPKIPKGYRRSEKPGLLIIYFKFETDFDNVNCITQAHLTFSFKWMRTIFKKYFNI